MATHPDRPEFRDWVDGEASPRWNLMPLTHITKGITAEDVARADKLEPFEGPEFDREPLTYLFYGRPAYRVHGDGTIKVEASCPFCFIFSPDLIARAKQIHAFDTGAFEARLYKHVMLDEMHVDDFSLQRDTSRPNKLIKKVFRTREAYFNGDLRQVVPKHEIVASWDILANAYVQLITSEGRNEPDDRIASIEVSFADPIPLEGTLMAVVVPHTYWTEAGKAPWLSTLGGRGVKVIPYQFIPGRAPDYYYALIESEVRALFRTWGHL